MKKIISKKIVLSLCLFLLVVGLIGCGKTEGNEDKKTITIGVSVGPYNDLFNDGIKPILEKQGYTIKDVSFSEFIQSNIALTEGKIDFNVAQHTAYANSFNSEKGSEIVPIIHVPTVPAGIFSSKHTSLNDLKDGDIVAIPKDPSNAARAFNLLKKAGWIKLKDGIDPVKATLNDVTENPHNIDIRLMDSTQIPHAMDDIDFGVLPGSIVYEARMDKSKVLLAEDVIRDLEIIVAVDKKNENTQWAKDIVAAYKSDDFKKYLSENNKDNYWQIPDELK